MIRQTLLVCVLVVAAGPGQAAESFRYPEGRHGKGELRYINDIPVLVLAGTPEEMGEQMGVLAVKPAAGAIGILKNVLKVHKLDLLVPLLVQFGNKQLAKYPDAYRREFEAMAKASGLDRNLLVIGNTFGELRHLAGCSGLMIDAAHSKTGAPLMGRNWDFPPVEGMAAYSLVIVLRPEGKRAFAVVSFPGSVASSCQSSAMNDGGLAIGGNFIGQSSDNAPAVDWNGTPNAVLARRVMEECGSIEEAERLVRAAKPSERGSVVACDRQGGAVLEITAKTFIVRRGKDGICAGTNHFLSPGLATSPTFSCPRLNILKQAEKMGKLGVADVAKKMDEANQKKWTVHTMVFEPQPLILHVAFSDGEKSATAFPLKEIDLGRLMKGHSKAAAK